MSPIVDVYEVIYAIEKQSEDLALLAAKKRGQWIEKVHGVFRFLDLEELTE